MPLCDPILKNCFIWEVETLKKNNIGRTRILRWVGREIVVVGLPPLVIPYMDKSRYQALILNFKRANVKFILLQDTTKNLILLGQKCIFLCL